MTNDVSRLLQAANFAARKHQKQRRKNVEASPYINHPLAVAYVLANEGNVIDADLLIAAVLHDTIEDTETSLDELKELFGEDAAKLVSEVTDDKSLPKERRKQLQVENAPLKSDRAKQLKMADKICNIRDINTESPANWDQDRKAKYLDWAVSGIAGCRGVNDQLEQRFDEAIEDARGRLL